MAIEILRYDSPGDALEQGEPFLAGDPVLNNLILTLLAARKVHPEPGRYWVAFEGRRVAGMAFQSPLDRPIILSAMSPEVASAMAGAIGAEGDDLPGVLGEARIAASFAGEWGQRRKIGAVPIAGQRIYEARATRDGPAVPGGMECARTAHYARVRDWALAFGAEIGEPVGTASEFAERAIAAGEIWLWHHGGVRSIAAVRPPAHATVRLSLVYTPPEHRRHGYAEGLVRTLTQRLLGEGLRPTLYADLANPTPNGVYRRIGYEAAAEIVRYRFGPPREASK